MKKCIFLDRDGVLNTDTKYYTYLPEDVVLIDGVAVALKRLKEAGYLLIVITNQAGIAKKEYGPAEVRAVHELLQHMSGTVLDDLYFSSHHPEHSSRSLRRKPDSLMIEKAIAKHGIDPTQSWMIGDKISDVQAGRKAGVRTIFTGKKGAGEDFGDFQAQDLREAADFILRNQC
ncbi:D-glycero-alpha-D-manno-heptose-1,7-bisphosphate 7-phosphatase [Salmonirosea aquatica]|uniref:D,D-heptose 1,7-bisphosphate phosphatase n=1 Tax=Salmonirosea aquatica TaxID=2654236 RepID=A0A7C9BHB5_9BACT|nr:HAD-IIIA family hydrolase [Cytophagaceae bacterium SJW1-29]